MEAEAENTRKAFGLRDKVGPRERGSKPIHGTWTPYSNLVALYAELAKYEKALEEAREELRLFPNVGDSYYNVGSLYLFLGRLDEAEAVFKQAEQHKLESEPLLAYRDQLAFLRGDEGEMWCKPLPANWGKKTCCSSSNPIPRLITGT